MDIEIWVLGWDKAAAVKQCERAAKLVGDDRRVHWLCRYDHEPAVQNYALEHCHSKYWHFLHTDVQIPHPHYLEEMYEYMEAHPGVGLIRPNREGERCNMAAHPHRKYWDGIAPLYRMSVGARFDEDFIFTQSQDLDFGYEVDYLGYQVLVDPRVSVNHSWTAYGAKPPFYFGYAARNHLLLDVKWRKVGRKDWKGLEWYNGQVSLGERIPTMFELAGYSREQLQMFSDSVETEMWEFKKDTGNLTWQNPVVMERRAK